MFWARSNLQRALAYAPSRRVLKASPKPPEMKGTEATRDYSPDSSVITIRGVGYKARTRSAMHNRRFGAQELPPKKALPITGSEKKIRHPSTSSTCHVSTHLIPGVQTHQACVDRHRALASPDFLVDPQKTGFLSLVDVADRYGPCVTVCGQN